MSKDVELGISGQDEGLEAALSRAAVAVQSATARMHSSFDRLGALFDGIQRRFLALTAILAGGQAFRAAIEKTIELTKESEDLGRQLGISATQASVLKAAMGNTFVSQEQVSA